MKELRDLLRANLQNDKEERERMRQEQVIMETAVSRGRFVRRLVELFQQIGARRPFGDVFRGEFGQLRLEVSSVGGRRVQPADW